MKLSVIIKILFESIFVGLFFSEVCFIKLKLRWDLSFDIQNE